MDIFECQKFINEYCDGNVSRKMEKAAANVFKDVCKIAGELKLDDLTFYTDRTPKFINASVVGEEMKIVLYLSVDDEFRQFLLISLLPFNYNVEAEKELITVCNYINANSMYGYFAVDTENRVISFNCAAHFDEKGLSDDVIKYQIMKACSTVDIYNGAIQRVSDGGTFADFLREFED